MNTNKTIYYDDLPIKEMIKQHDFTYCMADDGRAYKRGRNQRTIINNKVEELGGWSEELVNYWNECAPGDMEVNNMFKMKL
tara:strand:+ start:632 stop:874 length:243 start_codon:yes stop_codon:yes gene_type:complete